MRQKGFEFGGKAAPRNAKPEPSQKAERRALTVSQLTDRIQGVLETEFLDVWVEGEISNLKLAPSGHWYFSLKDDKGAPKAATSIRFVGKGKKSEAM